MLQKLTAQHNSNKYFVKMKSDLNQAFGINHFAGTVFYSTSGFLEKNRDTFSADLLGLLTSNLNNNKFLKTLFSNQGESSKSARTLSSQFKRSLDALMATLAACQPYFVRTIKPNEKKSPNDFDRALVCRQLRYSGMMETIRIRRAGYPIRHGFREFVERFRFLVAGCPPPHKGEVNDSARRICSEVLGKRDYQIGRTKV